MPTESVASQHLTGSPLGPNLYFRREVVRFDANGLRRTPEDKMIAVRRLLLDDEWGAKADNWIAKHARVSHTFVAQQRRQIPKISICNESNGNPGKRKCSDGREYPAKRITRKPSVAPHVPPIEGVTVTTCRPPCTAPLSD